MATEYNQREHMERVIAEKGSVYFKGAIITKAADLPPQSVLAKGNSDQEAAARANLERRRAEIDNELQSLTPPVSAKAEAVGGEKRKTKK